MLVNKNGVIYRGRVTLEGRLADVLVLRDHPRAKKGDAESTSPAYEVFRERDGREYAIGAAWIKNHERVGDFLSMTLDSPKWPRSLNLTVFPPDKDNSNEWSVVWSRPRGSRVQDENFDELAQENVS